MEIEIENEATGERTTVALGCEIPRGRWIVTGISVRVPWPPPSTSRAEGHWKPVSFSNGTDHRHEGRGITLDS